MKIWKAAFVIIAVFAMITALNGCYTMLRHPRVSSIDSSTGNEMTTKISYGERCTDCHTGDVHGSMYGYGQRYRWYDYDPFWGYNRYYDPWFGNSWYGSSYFYDSYYRYYAMPWWWYQSGYSGINGNASGEGEPVQKEKPARRGLGSSSRRGATPPETESNENGAQKPAPTNSLSPEQDDTSDDVQKQKPKRRGVK